MPGNIRSLFPWTLWRAERRSLLSAVVVLLFWLNIGAVMAGRKNTVRIDRFERGSFRLTTGSYIVEFGKQTGNRVLIHKSGAKGVLYLRFWGGGGRSSLFDSAPDITRLAKKDTLAVRLAGKNAWSEYWVTLYAYKNRPGLLHWTADLRLKDSPPVLQEGPDLQMLQRKNGVYVPVDPGDFIIGLGPRHPTYLYAKQAPFTTPVIYFCSPPWIRGTLFYVADLTALNAFFEKTNSGASKIMVELRNFDATFGFVPPLKKLRDLPPGEKVTVLDSYLYLTDEYPRDEADVALRFLDFLAAVYDYLQKPASSPVDWRALAQKEIQDLSNPELWVTIDGRPYLRAYVSDTRRSAELISQLDLLLPLTKYQLRFGGVQSYVEKLTATLPSFYAEKYRLLNNNFPNIEEGDSWYLIEEMTQLAKLSKLGNRTAEEILFRSVENTIKLAHNVGYEFPNHFSYVNLKPTFGREPDVAGGYAYLMLELYDLKKDQRFLEEAKRALEHTIGRYFNLNYEMQMTAMTAAAAARLFKLTGDKGYLAASYMPLANLFLATWLWECDYGAAKDYATFFGLSPMLHSGVITMKEQYEVWSYLNEYLRLVNGDLPDFVRKLLAEFHRYSLYTLQYTLPPLLPAGAATAQPSAYPTVTRNDLSLYIPLEDLREGRSQSGRIGQQIYGAGGPITFAVEAYKELRPGLVLYSEYPVVSADRSSFRLGGTPDADVRGLLLSDDPVRLYDSRGRQVPGRRAKGGAAVYKLRGGQTYFVNGRK